MRKRAIQWKNLRLLAFIAVLFASTALAQTVPVLMLSDIHLDPFHDPSKFARLRSAPVTGWADILNAAPSSTQATDFAKLQTTCNATGLDTPMSLLNAALTAAQKQQPAPLFVTVSGDLMAHRFDCRFHTLAPTATAAEYSNFAAKTIDFVALQLRLFFPHSPIYFALGNNDSGCADYREDPDSSFLQSAATSFAADALSVSNSRAIHEQFTQRGDYVIKLPAPIQNTRLVVLQDIFESVRYTGCNAASNNVPIVSQITWLRNQLEAARAAHEHVWLMTHIPPGVDAYATFSKQGSGICNVRSPAMFLKSDALANTLADFPDTIRLILLGHTHMDEMRIYRTPNGTIPGKLVPSITPVDGNRPSFTIGEVETSTATLKDYAVYAADNDSDISTPWNLEYRYSTTYHQPDFSGESAAKLATIFLADKNGSSPDSSSYQHYFFVGDASISAAFRSAAMQIVWPAYACTITSAQVAGFLHCACGSTPVQ